MTVGFLFVTASKSKGLFMFAVKMTPQPESRHSPGRRAAILAASQRYAAANSVLAFNFKMRLIKELPQALPAYHTLRSPSKPLRPHEDHAALTEKSISIARAFSSSVNFTDSFALCVCLAFIVKLFTFAKTELDLDK